MGAAVTITEGVIHVKKTNTIFATDKAYICSRYTLYLHHVKRILFRNGYAQKLHNYITKLHFSTLLVGGDIVRYNFYINILL